jgi:hypothetical protein
MSAVETIELLHANSYQDFQGNFQEGKVHFIRDIVDREEDGFPTRWRTYCGKTEKTCPGEITEGFLWDVTCKVCITAQEGAERRAAQSAIYAAEREERERQRAEADKQWWAAYGIYLQSPIWLEKRRLVLRRCGGICEGCGVRKAVQVHHLEYPKDCLPGSPEWLRQEKLFHLVALCLDCHDDLHGGGLANGLHGIE